VHLVQSAPQKRIIVAISGASGAVYGVRLLQLLAELGHVQTHVTVSEAGFLNLQQELDMGRAEVEAFLAKLKSDRRFAKATHNSWAVILADGGPLKNDDGEAGAGAVILRMLERAELRDHVVVVTRWYGGTNLGGDRFRHVVGGGVWGCLAIGPVGGPRRGPAVRVREPDRRDRRSPRSHVRVPQSGGLHEPRRRDRGRRGARRR